MSQGRDWATIRIRGSVNSTATSSLVSAPAADASLLSSQPQIVVDQVQLSTDASGQFTGIALMDNTSGGAALSLTWALLGSDYVNTGAFNNTRCGIGKALCLQRTAVAGTLYYDITYHIEG